VAQGPWRGTGTSRTPVGLHEPKSFCPFVLEFKLWVPALQFFLLFLCAKCNSTHDPIWSLSLHTCLTLLGQASIFSLLGQLSELLLGQLSAVFADSC
jgi:hypothetical protein